MSSIAQAKKDALIANLVEARKNIQNVASALPAKQRDEISLGSWSVKDLLAHLIGWDHTNHRQHPSGGTERRKSALQADYQVRRIGDFHSLIVSPFALRRGLPATARGSCRCRWVRAYQTPT